MSDSEDFVDDNATEESEDELEPNQPRINCGKRGKDIPWQEMKNFATTKDYNDSELATEIKDMFSARAIRESDAADTIRYMCKFARKVGWQVEKYGNVICMRRKPMIFIMVSTSSGLML